MAFKEVLISPFGKVQFRHYWLATVLSTMTKANADMGLIFLYFNEGYWLKLEPVDKKEHHMCLKVYLIIIAILPPWWRMWQSIRKWYDSDNKWHLVNAMKYFSMFLPVLVVKAFDA